MARSERKEPVRRLVTVLTAAGLLLALAAGIASATDEPSTTIIELAEAPAADSSGGDIERADPPAWPPADEERFREAVERFCECMRRQGVDLPEPETDHGVAFPIGEGGVDVEAFERAEPQCRQHLEEAMA